VSPRTLALLAALVLIMHAASTAAVTRVPVMPGWLVPFPVLFIAAEVLLVGALGAWLALVIRTEARS
jgi:hypothetical protein